MNRSNINNGNYIVTFAGKFQPFHRGHYYVYNKLLTMFIPERVFITTAEIQKFDDDHFLTFSEKATIMNKIFRIPNEKIIKVKNNYNPVEILTQFPSDTVFITVLGYKDAERLNKGKYYLPFRWNDSFYYSYKDRGYYLIMDGPPINARDIRKYFIQHRDDENKLMKYFKEFFGVYDEEIFRLFYRRLSMKNIKEVADGDEENIIELNEGGAFGHILNIWEDAHITFAEIREMLSSIPQNKIENITEKYDGFALAITVKDNEVYAARNKTEIKNFGERALNRERFLEKFSSHAYKKIFIDGFNALEFCLKNLINKNENLDKYFLSGRSFLHVELIEKSNERIIEYDENYIIFHGISEYNVNGEEINYSKDRAHDLYELILKYNLNTVNEYKILFPESVRFNLDEINTKELINYLNAQLASFYNSYNINDKTTIKEYLFNNIILTVPVQLRDNNEMRRLIEQAIDDPLKFKVYSKNIRDEDVRNYWNENYENLKSKYYELIFEVKKIIIRFSLKLFKYITNLLGNITSVNSVTPNDEKIKKIRDRLLQSIDLFEKMKKNNGDVEKINNKILFQLERSIWELKQLNYEILPFEGVVFKYNNKLYKLTGTYGLINKLIVDIEKFLINK